MKRMVTELFYIILYVGVPWLFVGMGIEGGSPPQWAFWSWIAVVLATIVRKGER